jgi:hypothetical protein
MQEVCFFETVRFENVEKAIEKENLALMTSPSYLASKLTIFDSSF